MWKLIFEEKFFGITHNPRVCFKAIVFPHSKILRNKVKSDIKTLYEQNTELYKCNIFWSILIRLLKRQRQAQKINW